MLYRKLKAASKARKTNKLPKTPKKIGVAQLKKKADLAFSLWIRYRTAAFDRGEWLVECVTCGVVKPIRHMQNGHFVSRKVTLLRYDERNCNPQCPACNVFRHGELYLYGEWLDRTYGEGTANELMSQRFTSHKLTVGELETIIVDSRAKVLAMDPDVFKGRQRTGRKQIKTLTGLSVDVE